MSYNIRFGGVGRAGALTSVIAPFDPDVVVLQEATRPDVVRQMAEALGMSSWVSDPERSVGFMSRVPIESYRWHRTPPSRRAFLEILPEGGSLRVFGVHLTAVHSNWTERLRALEVRALLASVKQHQHGLHVVLGDFNTLAPGATLSLARLPRRLRAVVWLTGRRIRWRTIQLMLDASYLDAYRSLHAEPAGYTFPTWDPHLRLDYAFVPAAWRQRLLACDVPPNTEAARQASDHLPLCVEVETDAPRAQTLT